MKDEGSSSKAPEGTPEVSRLEDVTEGGSTAPEGKAGPSSSAAAAEVSPSSKDVVTEPSTGVQPPKQHLFSRAESKHQALF